MPNKASVEGSGTLVVARLCRSYEVRDALENENSVMFQDESKAKLVPPSAAVQNPIMSW